MVSFKDVVRVVSEKSGMTLKDSELILKIYHETIIGLLEEKEEIRIIGFGSYSVPMRNARAGINPATGEQVTVDAHYVPVFKFSQSVKDGVKKANPINVPTKKKKTASRVGKSKK